MLSQDPLSIIADAPVARQEQQIGMPHHNILWQMSCSTVGVEDHRSIISHLLIWGCVVFSSCSGKDGTSSSKAEGEELTVGDPSDWAPQLSKTGGSFLFCSPLTPFLKNYH